MSQHLRLPPYAGLFVHYTSKNGEPMGSPFALSIQPPHAEVQIGGEGHPKEVGKLEPGRPEIHLGKDLHHPDHQSPQPHQPCQGQAKGLEVEKEDAPKEVDGQLEQKDLQSPCALFGRRRQPYPGRPHPHQGVQDHPDDGEDNARRR